MSHPVAWHPPYAAPAVRAASRASDWGRFTQRPAAPLLLPQGRERPPVWQRLLCGCCSAGAVDAYHRRIGAVRTARAGWLNELRAQTLARMGSGWFNDAAVRRGTSEGALRQVRQLMTMPHESFGQVRNGELVALVDALRAAKTAYDAAAYAVLDDSSRSGVARCDLEKLVYAHVEEAFSVPDVAARAQACARERLGEDSADAQALARTVATFKATITKAVCSQALAWRGAGSDGAVPRTVVAQALERALAAEALLPEPAAPGGFAAPVLRTPARERPLDAKAAAERGRVALGSALQATPPEALPPPSRAKVARDFDRALESAVARSPSRQLAPSAIDRLALRAVRLNVDAAVIHLAPQLPQQSPVSRSPHA